MYIEKYGKEWQKKNWISRSKFPRFEDIKCGKFKIIHFILHPIFIYTLPLLWKCYKTLKIFISMNFRFFIQFSWRQISIKKMICHQRSKWLGLNSSCSRNLKHFGNPKKWNFAQKSQILWGKWISGGNVHKSADYWDTQFFLFSQKFHDQSFFQNCEKTEPGTTFLEISLDLAYSIDSKNGLTFENW